MRVTHSIRALAVLVLATAIAAPAMAQAPDTILIGGRIVTLDPQSSVREAIAIRNGRIQTVGTTVDVRRLGGPSTRVIDLEGRVVIPGLIDSHMHAIRAALSFSTEVNWIGVPSLADALGRISAAARERPPGSWLIVAGGWNVQQFTENRRPTQAELVAAAPANPVYVQLGYGWALMTPAALNALRISGDDDLPPGGRLERDGKGQPTGAVVGPQSAIVALFDRLPKPTFAEQLDGTRRFFRELNRLALTGVGDPGGNNITAESYQALFKVWRDRQLTVRVTYTLGTQSRGSELEELEGLTQMLPMQFGDGMLRFNGIGERITAGLYNNDAPSEAEKESFYQVAKWAAGRGLGLTAHWNRDQSVHHLLSIFDRVNAEAPLAPLRWSIAHLNDASPRTLERMKALGIGWTMQDAMYFGGEQFLQQAGPEAARRAPPVETARRIGVVVGAGTDAHRVASYNPFTALQWLLDGKTVGGIRTRGPEETPDRLQALRLYTLGSAWFSHDEHERGSLEAGKLADLAVLSADYLTMPVDRIGALESVLTIVGGEVVYAAGVYAALEGSRRGR